jgi:PhnB protein
MIHLTPFLLFDGNCAEAMAFYQSCLGGELILTKVGDTPMKEQIPPNLHHKTIYARLKSEAIEFSGADWLHPTRVPKEGNRVGIYIFDGTYDEFRAIFDKLSVGADQATLDDLRDMLFGNYGHLADKYGVHWTFRGEVKHKV